MANFTFTGNTNTIGTTEFSVAQNANYSSGSPKTTLGYVYALLDVNALAAGDDFRVRIYEKVNGGTQRVVFEAELIGLQVQPIYTFPVLLLGEGWDVTVKKIAGTDRSILASVRQDTNDVNALTIANGAIAAATFAASAITSSVLAANAIGASQIASAAITAAKFAADAVDSNALAADAVAEIQSGLALAATALSTAQWTNTRAGNLDNLDASVASRAPAATALSTAQYTSARAGYLDNLNVGGPVAAQAEVVAIQNNTRVVRVVPEQIFIPASSTLTFRVELLLYDEVGNMEVPDADPTIALVNQAGTDRSSRLSSTTMTSVSSGRYRVTYTSTVGDAAEQLVWTFSVVEGGATRLYGNNSAVVDQATAGGPDFTSSDRALLTQLATDYTTARAAKVDNLDATVSSRASASSLASVASDVDDIQARLPAALDGSGNIKAGVESVTPGALSSVAGAIFGFVVESGAPATARSFLQQLRVMWAVLAGKATGLAISSSGSEAFRDAADTKDRATFTLGSGARTPGTLDGD